MYNTHTDCTTEMECYSAEGAVFTVKTEEERKTKNILMCFKDLLSSKDLRKSLREVLEIVSNHDNVPRKENKFGELHETH